MSDLLFLDYTGSSTKDGTVKKLRSRKSCFEFLDSDACQKITQGAGFGAEYSLLQGIIGIPESAHPFFALFCPVFI